VSPDQIVSPRRAAIVDSPSLDETEVHAPASRRVQFESRGAIPAVGGAFQPSGDRVSDLAYQPTAATAAPRAAAPLDAEAGGAPAGDLAVVLDLVDRVCLGGPLPDAAEWSTLGRHATAIIADQGARWNVMSQVARAGDRLAHCLRRAGVTWENATDDHRKVFRALPGDLGEALRTELLKNSRLFHAMTSMHLTANDYAESRALVDQQRIGGTPWEATTGSSFAMIKTGDIARKALFDPATDAARQHNALPNAALAGWVAAHETAAHDYLGQIACGVSNLFALACARRAVAVSEPPTDDEAALWLRSWTLDRPPSQALLAYTGGEEPQYQPINVVSSPATARADRQVSEFSIPATAQSGADPDASRQL
jgi:hypothetical protein